MAAFHKLYRPLWSWSCKFHGSAHSLCVTKLANTRKVIPLNIIIADHADVYDTILKENRLSSAEWQSIRERILRIRNVTTATVDSTIMDLCLKDFKVDKAMEYYKFLKEHNYPLSVAIIGRYLRFYVLKQSPLTEADKTEIVATYNALREKYPYLDANTAEQCIVSLCLTDQWEKTHEIIDMMKITTVPGTTVYSALAAAAFRNDKPDVAWKALSMVAARNLIPQQAAYTSHLQFCERDGKAAFDGRLEEMFAYWAENVMMPYNRVISAYANAAGEHGWSTTATTVSKTGRCRHCSHSLSNITFDENSFRELAESVMSRVIVGSDIYHKTNPLELKRFKEFIEETKPYDVVIDGLNMTYIQKRPSVPFYETLLNVVDYFVKRGKKVLVLTRKHQKKLSVFNYIQQHAFAFYTDNLSSDDPYMLYATMASGSNAMFVSMDLMRQHKYLLQDVRLQREFKKWQCSHQYFIRTKRGSVNIQKPFVYMPTAQKNAEHWHIPYVNDDFTYVDLHEFPDKWYCFRHNKKN